MMVALTFERLSLGQKKQLFYPILTKALLWGF